MRTSPIRKETAATRCEYMLKLSAHGRAHGLTHIHLDEVSHRVRNQSRGHRYRANRETDTELTGIFPDLSQEVGVQVEAPETGDIEREATLGV